MIFLSSLQCFLAILRTQDARTFVFIKLDKNGNIRNHNTTRMGGDNVGVYVYNISVSLQIFSVTRFVLSVP